MYSFVMWHMCFQCRSSSNRGCNSYETLNTKDSVTLSDDSSDDDDDGDSSHKKKKKKNKKKKKKGFFFRKTKHKACCVICCVPVKPVVPWQGGNDSPVCHDTTGDCPLNFSLSENFLLVGKLSSKNTNRHVSGIQGQK